MPVQMKVGGRAIALQARTAMPLNMQFVLDEGQIQQMISAIRAGNKKEFKRLFRAAAPRMDEEISCESTYQAAQGMDDAQVRHLLITSDQTRMSTGATAHYVRMQDGSTSRMVHPTSDEALMVDAERTAKGRIRTEGHTSFDTRRRDYVSVGTTVDEMRDRGIEYTLNYGAQPFMASNSVNPLPVADPRVLEAHELRERRKSEHSEFDESRSQPIDAPWYPGARKRGVSPPRRRRAEEESVCPSCTIL